MTVEWTALIGEASIAGGVVAGIVICYKIRRNGCPARPVLDEQHAALEESKTVNKGLTEAVNRNTAASERQTDVMSKLVERLIEEK